MDVTLNVQIAVPKADAVHQSLGQVVGIRRVDTDLAHRGLLVVHADRHDVRRIHESLLTLDGVIGVRRGTLVTGL